MGTVMIGSSPRSSASFNEERIVAAAIFTCSAWDLYTNANVPMPFL